MSDLYQDLKSEFQDPDYRYGYAESFLNTKLATQIKTLREQRDKTQAEIAAQMGIKQPGYRRFEDVNHSVWKTDSLWNIARALGVRLNISFETFGSLPEEKKLLNKNSLERPTFEDDPAFVDQSGEGIAAAVANAIALQQSAVTNVGGDLSWLRMLEAGNQAIATYADSFYSKSTLQQLAGMTSAVTGLGSITPQLKATPAKAFGQALGSLPLSELSLNVTDLEGNQQTVNPTSNVTDIGAYKKRVASVDMSERDFYVNRQQT